MTGWTEQQYEDASAHLCERMLRIEITEAKAQEAIEKRARGGI